MVVPDAARLNYELYPVAALEWLRESRPAGDVMVEFVRGSYALWRLYPDFRVSMDGRYEEVYPQSTFDDVALAFRPGLEGHEEAFSRVDPDFIVLDNEHPAAADPGRFGAGWGLAYQDSAFTVLEKPAQEGPPANAPLAIRPVWDPLF